MLNCSLKWWDFVPLRNLIIVILHKTTFTMKAKESSNSKESVQCLNKLRTLFGISLTTTEISSCITARQDSCYLHRDMPMQFSTLTLLLRWISTKNCSSLGQKMKEWKQKECCHQCIFPWVLAWEMLICEQRTSRWFQSTVSWLLDQRIAWQNYELIAEGGLHFMVIGKIYVTRTWKTCSR